MAIKGISDVKILPRLGKIRTGIKKMSQKGSEYPEEVPYFVLNATEEIRDKMGNVTGTRENEHIQALINLYGEQPHEMQIMFPVDDLTLVADPWMKWWAGDVKKRKATLQCKGDGEYAFYKGKEQVSGLDGVIPPHKLAEGYNRICNRDMCPQAQSGKCKPNMNLMFVVPEYSMYGVFQIDTTSAQAMTAILSSIDVARNALRLEGINSITGVPLRLFRDRTPNKYNNVNYIMKLEVNQTHLKTQKNLMLEGRPSQLAIGMENYAVESFLDEPNYDLLPKSEHGAYQTGEEAIDVTEALPPVDKGSWLSDPTILEKFKTLGDLTGKEPLKPRMKATADKFETREELMTYLDNKTKEIQVKA